jgi:ferredoxin--NADP+ reductase
VAGITLVRNVLVTTPSGSVQAKATTDLETLPVGLVFRSVGYRGVPLPGVPFHEAWGVILNEKGRVLAPETKQPLLGQYTAGWIKRGPSGVIGTNKPDALETVQGMLEDVAEGRVRTPEHPERDAVAALVAERQPRYFTYADWLRLNEIEVSKGRPAGRPRIKLTSVEDMLGAVGR